MKKRIALIAASLLCLIFSLIAPAFASTDPSGSGVSGTANSSILIEAEREARLLTAVRLAQMSRYVDRLSTHPAGERWATGASAVSDLKSEGYLPSSLPAETTQNLSFSTTANDDLVMNRTGLDEAIRDSVAALVPLGTVSGSTVSLLVSRPEAALEADLFMPKAGGTFTGNVDFAPGLSLAMAGGTIKEVQSLVYQGKEMSEYFFTSDEIRDIVSSDIYNVASAEIANLLRSDNTWTGTNAFQKPLTASDINLIGHLSGEGDINLNGSIVTAATLTALSASLTDSLVMGASRLAVLASGGLQWNTVAHGLDIDALTVSGDAVVTIGPDKTVRNDIRYLMLDGNEIYTGNLVWYDGTDLRRVSGAKISQADALAEALLPDGGTTGQVLGKLSDADQDAGWIDAPNYDDILAMMRVPDHLFVNVLVALAPDGGLAVDSSRTASTSLPSMAHYAIYPASTYRVLASRTGQDFSQSPYFDYRTWPSRVDVTGFFPETGTLGRAPIVESEISVSDIAAVVMRSHGYDEAAVEAARKMVRRIRFDVATSHSDDGNGSWHSGRTFFEAMQNGVILTKAASPAWQRNAENEITAFPAPWRGPRFAFWNSYTTGVSPENFIRFVDLVDYDREYYMNEVGVTLYFR